MNLSVQLFNSNSDPACCLIDREAWHTIDQAIAKTDVIQDGIIDTFILISGSDTDDVFSLQFII